MFVESSTWNPKLGQETGLDIELGESLGMCTRRPQKERRGPEYLPVPSGKHVGRVTFYNPERGFGRISGDLFFHVSGFIDGNSGFVTEGVTVAYEEAPDRRGVKAVDIQLINTNGGV